MFSEDMSAWKNWYCLATLVDATCLLCGFITHLVSTRQGSKGRFKCIPLACNMPIQLHYRANPTWCSNNFIFLHVYAGLGKAGELNTPNVIRDHFVRHKTSTILCMQRMNQNKSEFSDLIELFGPGKKVKNIYFGPQFFLQYVAFY
jgi:hypothetical protein